MGCRYFRFGILHFDILFRQFLVVFYGVFLLFRLLFLLFRLRFRLGLRCRRLHVHVDVGDVVNDHQRFRFIGRGRRWGARGWR